MNTFTVCTAVTTVSVAVLTDDNYVSKVRLQEMLMGFRLSLRE